MPFPLPSTSRTASPRAGRSTGPASGRVHSGRRSSRPSSHRRRPIATPAGAAVAVAWTVGCVPAEAPAELGASAPDVTVAALGGDTVALSSFRGRPLLVNLWATWCVPCRQEAPYLQRLHRSRKGQGLEVVGITVDARGFESEIRDFVAEFGLEYTVLHDPDMASVERFAAPGLPATFLIDRDWTLRYAVAGPVEEGDRRFEEALRVLLE